MVAATMAVAVMVDADYPQAGRGQWLGQPGQVECATAGAVREVRPYQSKVLATLA